MFIDELQYLQNNKTYGKDSINPDHIFEYGEFCHSFPTVLGNLPKYNTINFMRKNRGSDLNKNLINIIGEEINLFDLRKSFKINPFNDFFAKKTDENFTSKHLMFEKEIIWNGEINDFQKWENLIERVGEFGYNNKKFHEEYFTNTPIVLTQSAINPEILFDQNEKIIETMFETYRTPFLLITSQATLSIMSNNQLSGFVVDMGESGTQFTSVIDGFTQYHDSSYSSFLSGRNLNLLYHYEKQRNKNSKSRDYEDYNLNYLQYIIAKNEREAESNKFYEHGNDNYIDIEEFNGCDGLFFYPKIFRNILLKKNNPTEFKSLNKPVFLLEFLLKSHLNNDMIEFQTLLKNEMFKDIKELIKSEVKDGENEKVRN